MGDHVVKSSTQTTPGIIPDIPAENTPALDAVDYDLVPFFEKEHVIQSNYECAGKTTGTCGPEVLFYEGQFSFDVDANANPRIVGAPKFVNVSVMDPATRAMVAPPPLYKAGSWYYRILDIFESADPFVPASERPAAPNINSWPAEHFIAAEHDLFGTRFMIAFNDEVRIVDLPWEQSGKIIMDHGVPIELTHKGYVINGVTPVSEAPVSAPYENMDPLIGRMGQMWDDAQGIGVYEQMSAGEICDADAMMELRVYNLTEPVEPIDLVSRVEPVDLTIKILDPKYIETAAVSDPGLFSAIPEGARSIFLVTRASSAECAANAGMLVAIGGAGLVTEQVVENVQGSPVTPAQRIGIHGGIGIPVVAGQLGMEYSAAVEAGMAPAEAATSVGMNFALVGAAAVETFMAAEVVAQEIWGVDTSTFEGRAAVLGTAGVIIAVGAPFGPAGILAMAVLFSAGSLAGWGINEHGGEALFGESVGDAIGDVVYDTVGDSLYIGDEMAKFDHLAKLEAEEDRQYYAEKAEDPIAQGQKATATFGKF